MKSIIAMLLLSSSVFAQIDISMHAQSNKDKNDVKDFVDLQDRYQELCVRVSGSAKLDQYIESYMKRGNPNIKDIENLNKLARTTKKFEINLIKYVEIEQDEQEETKPPMALKKPIIEKREIPIATQDDYIARFNIELKNDELQISTYRKEDTRTLNIKGDIASQIHDLITNPEKIAIVECYKLNQ